MARLKRVLLQGTPINWIDLLAALADRFLYILENKTSRETDFLLASTPCAVSLVTLSCPSLTSFFSLSSSTLRV
jgi:hypothetical protein